MPIEISTIEETYYELIEIISEIDPYFPFREADDKLRKKLSYTYYFRPKIMLKIINGEY
jgi:hypothetical protein